MNPLSKIWETVRPSRPETDLDEMQRVLPTRIIQSLLDGSFARLQRGHSTRLERTLAALASSRDQSSWKNPEIYVPLIGMLNSPTEVDWLSNLSVLEFYTARNQDYSNLPDGFYRVGFPDFVVLRVRSGEAENLGEILTFTVERRQTIHVYPRPGLYTGLVGSQLYPPDGPNVGRSVQLQNLAGNAWNVLDSYDSSLASAVSATISRIVLTPDFNDDIRWSYSLRLRYLSGVFVNPFRVNIFGFVESMIHEYVHQRLWLWWAFDPLEGVTDSSVQVLSPVTGRTRSLAVMFHAFLIYIAVADFYRECVAVDNVSSKDKTWCLERQQKLLTSLPELYARLADAIDSDTLGHRVLEAVWRERPL